MKNGLKNWMSFRLITSIDEKGNMYVLGKHKAKNDLLNHLDLSHALQSIKDLFDPKSSELPTLMENVIPNKPMEYHTHKSWYHHVSERTPFNSSSTNCI